MRNKLRERQNEGGFTLIELLIVIVVLGILAGLVVFGVGQFRGDAESRACKSNAKLVQVAATASIAKTGLDLVGAATQLTIAEATAQLAGPVGSPTRYMDQLPSQYVDGTPGLNGFAVNENGTLVNPECAAA